LIGEENEDFFVTLRSKVVSTRHVVKSSLNQSIPAIASADIIVGTCMMQWNIRFRFAFRQLLLRISELSSSLLVHLTKDGHWFFAIGSSKDELPLIICHCGLCLDQKHSINVVNAIPLYKAVLIFKCIKVRRVTFIRNINSMKIKWTFQLLQAVDVARKETELNQHNLAQYFHQLQLRVDSFCGIIGQPSFIIHTLFKKIV
jgi:hypothetical protein